jgi:serine/threonine protein kinase
LQELKPAEKTRRFVVQDHAKGLDSMAVVKVFPTDGTDEPSRLLAFLLEAHAAAKLSHPHIAASAKPEQIQGLHFCVSDYREDADTLASLLNRQGWFDVAQTIEIVLQITDALQHAHQAEVLHLKLQPEAIWIKDGKITVTDFGIPSKPVRSWAYQNRSQQCAMAYRSPEQLANSNADERSDLYSLGVLLYEMLTDVLPFHAVDEKQLRQKIANQRVAAAHLIRPDIPEALSLILAKLLADRPEERFQDAAALHYAFANVLNYAPPVISVEPADPLTTSEWDDQGESEPLSFKFDEDQDFLAYEFEIDSLNSPLSLTDTEEEESVGELHANADQQALMPETAPASFAESFLSAPQQNHLDDPAMASHLPPTEAREEEELPAAAEANQRQSLPFLLLALGIVLLSAILVLAYKGYFKRSPQPATPVQTSVNAESSPSEIITPATANPQATGESESTTPALPESKPQATDDGSDVAERPRNASGVRASAPSQVRADTTRLREQLRQQNRGKAASYKVKKSYAKARPVKARPHKGFFRWRFW